MNASKILSPNLTRGRGHSSPGERDKYERKRMLLRDSPEDGPAIGTSGTGVAQSTCPALAAEVKQRNWRGGHVLAGDQHLRLPPISQGSGWVMPACFILSLQPLIFNLYLKISPSQPPFLTPMTVSLIAPLVWWCHYTQCVAVRPSGPPA